MPIQRISHRFLVRSQVRRHTAAFAGVAACIAAWGASAQGVPDAGALLRQLEQDRSNAVIPMPKATVPPRPAPAASDAGVTVEVRQFLFEGNAKLSNDQLTDATRPWVGRPLRFSDLQDAVAAVATVYERTGYLVRAYLPRQDATGGVVTIQIVEAVFGRVRTEGSSTRVPASRLEAIVTATLSAGEPVRAADVDRALLLVSDVPGVTSDGRLAEGDHQAETDLVLALSDGPAAMGDVGFDNAGSESTGKNQLFADFVLNSPFEAGDRAGLDIAHAKGSDYVHVAFSAPAGSNGWRVGANASRLDYRLVNAEFAPLHAIGTASAVGLEANYPLRRSQSVNAYVGLSATRSRFDNQALSTTTSRYSLTNGAISLDATSDDAVSGGGHNRASLVLSAGDVDLAGSPNQAADAAAARTDGRFHKLLLAFSREQSLEQGFSLFAAMSAQWASKNLDSSEKFVLGGPAGVRAFPSSRGAGDEGALFTAELRERLPAQTRVAAFLDCGTVWINKHGNYAGAAATSEYRLCGLGLWTDWQPQPGALIKASVAQPLETDPASSSGSGGRAGPLLTIQAELAF